MMNFGPLLIINSYNSLSASDFA